MKSSSQNTTNFWISISIDKRKKHYYDGYLFSNKTFGLDYWYTMYYSTEYFDDFILSLLKTSLTYRIQNK